jgi:uncharacterized protein (TIGR02246 family)
METAHHEELVRRQISAAYEQYAAALAGHDAAALAGLYDQDAVILPPGSLPVAGAAAIRAYCEGICALPYDFRVSGFTIEHAIVAGEYVIEVSRFISVSVPRDDSASRSVMQLKNLVVWRKRAGRWLIARDMYSDIRP